MKIVAIDTIYCDNIRFDSIIPMVRIHKENAKYSLISPTKPYHSLIYFNACRALYTEPGGNSMYAQTGDIVYIPKNTPYEVVFFDTQAKVPGCVRIEFNMYDSNGEEFAFYDQLTTLEVHHSQYLKEKFFDIANQYNVPQKPLLSVTSKFYNIMHHISITLHTHNLSQNEFSNILKGIQYIENDIEQNKSVAEIAKMCNVSTSYFRSSFKKYSGQSPIDYRINKKMERAKLLLENSKMTVSEVAIELSFKNVYYFSRLFKNKVGMNPIDYQKIYGR